MKTFDDGILEIYEHNGEGYERTMNFEAWRVAFLNCADRFRVTAALERHNLTDEVFVLLTGSATLLLGVGEADGVRVREVAMEPCKIYNVKKSMWHAIRVSEDARVLVVENHNTASENTDYLPISKTVGD